MWPFRKKAKLPNGYLNLRCVVCGSSTDADMKHMPVYCPNCGAELYVRAGKYKDLYEQIKNERTGK